MSFVPKNHRQQVDARGADDATDDRRTPDSVFVPLHEEHEFTIDVAASAANARCVRYFDRAQDGLMQSWAGEIAWCNPPYSELRAWVAKALHEVEQNGCRRVVMLLPANRTEQAWWQDLIEPIRDRGQGVTTRMLRGRTKFETPDGSPIKATPAGAPRGGRSHGDGTRPPFGCVVVVIEPRAALEAAS